MSSRPLLHVIDGSGYIYRAYFAIRVLTTASGEPTNAVYGFANMMRKVIKSDQPEHIAIAFDPGRHTFRNEIYPAYKQNRSAPPEDLPGQIPRIRQVTDTFRIPHYEVEGFEADDVIATLVKFALKHDFDVRLITGDKDLMQLVNDRVTVWEPMREQRYDVAGVEEKFGLPPSMMLDMFALTGDSSDNIPGVKGVGPKTAVKLLKEHGSLDGVLEAAKEGRIKGKICEKIAAAVDDAHLSKRLVTLRDDVPIELSVEDLRYPGVDHDAQRVLFTELEMTKLLDEPESAPAEEEEEAGPLVHLDLDAYVTVADEAGLAKTVEAIAKAGAVAITIESDNDRMVAGTVFGVGLATAPGDVRYVPVGGALSIDVVVGALKGALEDPKIAKLVSSAKVLHSLCAKHDIALANVAFDTSIGSYLLDPESSRGGPTSIVHGSDDGPHAARDVARIHLDHSPMVRSALLGRGKDRKRFDEIAVVQQTKFVGETADVVWRAADLMWPALKSAELTNVMTDVELPVAPVLASMERIGVRVDVGFLSELAQHFSKEIERLQAKCYEAAGQEFKLNSTAQLRKVLFEDLGLKIIKRTKTGPSTDASVLEELADAHPLPAAIVEYRQVTKLQSTYVESLPKMINPDTGRIHTLLSQVVAATGRLSSMDPNLQNIPIRTELGQQLRRAFIADEGCSLISVDYSQIELRVLAHFSREPVLMKAFEDEADVHTRTASVLFQLPPEEITREQRTQAKAVNFGVLYGMGPVRLARQLGIPRRTASQFVKDYFAHQPNVRALIDETLEGARKLRCVRTLLGRRRWVFDIDSKSRSARAAAERVAVNTPIQGTAADLMKLAMIRVHARLAEAFPRARLLLQVHDELLVEAPDEEAAAVSDLVKHEMEGVFPLAVNLTAQAHTGKDWKQAH